MASIALSIPSFLKDCIHLCETVQFARNYESSFAASEARLLLAGLKLKEWGRALGLIPEIDGAPTTAPPALKSLSDSDVQAAKKAFSLIYKSFENAELMSKRYVSQSDIQSLEAKGKESVTDRDGSGLAVRTKLVGWKASVSPITAGFRHRASFVIYRKAHFDHLIKTIVAATIEFAEAFSLQQPVHEALCEGENSSLMQSQPHSQCKADIVDKEDACQKALSALVFDKNQVSNGQCIDMGNEYESQANVSQIPSITVSACTFTGNGTSRFGHSVGVARSYKYLPRACA